MLSPGPESSLQPPTHLSLSVKHQSQGRGVWELLEDSQNGRLGPGMLPSVDLVCSFESIRFWYYCLTPTARTSSSSPDQGFGIGGSVTTSPLPPTPRICRHLRLQPPLVWIDLDALKWKCGTAAVQGSAASWKEEEGTELGNIPPHTQALLSLLCLPSTQHPHNPLNWDILTAASTSSWGLFSCRSQI